MRGTLSHQRPRAPRSSSQTRGVENFSPETRRRAPLASFEKTIATVSQVEGIGVDEWSQPTQRPSVGLSDLNFVRIANALGADRRNHRRVWSAAMARWAATSSLRVRA